MAKVHIPSPISFGQESNMSSRCRFEEPPLSCMPANGSKRSIADEDLFSFPGVMCLLLTSNWHHVWWWSIPCFREHVSPAPFDGFHPGPGLQSGKPEDRGLVAQAIRSEGNPDHQHRYTSKYRQLYSIVVLVELKNTVERYRFNAVELKHSSLCTPALLCLD